MVTRPFLCAAVVCSTLSVASLGNDFFDQQSESMDGYVPLEQTDIQEKKPKTKRHRDKALVPNNSSIVEIIASVRPEKRHLSRNELRQIEDTLNAGASIEERDKTFGSTSLMFAAQRNDKPLVTLLLNYGANALAVNGTKTVA